MIERDVNIINRLGLHARAASKLANLCGKFESNIAFSKHTQNASGKSLMSLMLLAASQGSVIHVQCDGKDEVAAMKAVCALIADRFGESE